MINDLKIKNIFANVILLDKDKDNEQFWLWCFKGKKLLILCEGTSKSPSHALSFSKEINAIE